MFVKPKRHVNKVFIHCSATDNPKHDDIKVIKRWHVQDNGWSDVGYHFFIKADGAVQKGRPLHRVPSAQQGHNAGSIAICLHGFKEFTQIQFYELHKLCKQIKDAYNGDITFHGHCEVANKSCPVFDYKEVLGLDADGYMAGVTNSQRRAQELNKERPLNKTRTAKGKNVATGGAGAALAATGVEVAAKEFETVRDAIAPLAEYSDYIKLLLLIIAIAGVWYIWHARKDDRDKGYR